MSIIKPYRKRGRSPMADCSKPRQKTEKNLQGRGMVGTVYLIPSIRYVSTGIDLRQNIICMELVALSTGAWFRNLHVTWVAVIVEVPLRVWATAHMSIRS